MACPPFQLHHSLQKYKRTLRPPALVLKKNRRGAALQEAVHLCAALKGASLTVEAAQWPALARSPPILSVMSDRNRLRDSGTMREVSVSWTYSLSKPAGPFWFFSFHYQLRYKAHIPNLREQKPWNDDLVFAHGTSQASLTCSLFPIFIV